MEQAEKKMQQEKEKAEKKEAIRIQKEKEKAEKKMQQEKEKAEKKEAIRIQKEKEENIIKERKHTIFRIGEVGKEHLKNSSTYYMWGLNSKTSHGKHFIKNAKPNNLLWFESGNMFHAVVTFVEFIKRENGRTNEELGWTEKDGDWDTLILYKDLYNISECELYPEIDGAATPRKYNKETCAINLPEEYLNIVRYSKITRTM